MVAGVGRDDRRSGGGQRRTVGARIRAGGRGRGGPSGRGTHPGGVGAEGEARGGRTATSRSADTAAGGGEGTDGAGDGRRPTSILRAEEEKGKRRRRRCGPLGSGMAGTTARCGGRRTGGGARRGRTRVRVSWGRKSRGGGGTSWGASLSTQGERGPGSAEEQHGHGGMARQWRHCRPQ